MESEKKLTPKQAAKRITKILKDYTIDPNFLKKTFEYVRIDLGIKGRIKKSGKMPEMLTEAEMLNFYNAVWKEAKPSHMILIKLLFYTGMRNAEIVNIKISDVDIDNYTIRVENGKGGKDRYVLFPESFKNELAQHIGYLSDKPKRKQAVYLFETSWKKPPTDRYVRKIIKTYADMAGITKRIYPHLFRHTLLTFLTSKGLVDRKVQLISGHSSKDSLAVYQNLSLKDVKEDYQRVMKEFPVK